MGARRAGAPTGPAPRPVSRRALLVGLAASVTACRRSAPPPPAGRRIVSTSPSMTEAVFALGRGAELVGRSSFCDHPPEAAGIPAIGGFSDPNVEALLGLSPTLVCGERGPAGPALPERLASLGVASFFPPLDRVADVAAMLEALGARLDAEEAGKELAKGLRDTVEAVRRRAAALPSRRVVFLFDYDPLVAAGPDCFPGELLTLAGATNPVTGPGKYPRLGVEGLLALDPDVLVDGAMVPGAPKNPAEVVPGLAGLRAVSQGRLVRLSSAAALRPGPRLGQGLEELFHLIHPEATATP